MGMLISVALFAVGLVLLIKGGDWFVDGATGIAKRFNLPDIVVGATVVSIGTTLPEVMVSTTGALAGSGAMAYGNAIGSIICNTALIAAISITCNPGPVNVKSMKTPVIFFFCSAALYCVASYFLGEFPRWMGFVMLAIFVVYTILTVRNGLKNPDAAAEEEEEAEAADMAGLWKEIALLGICAVVIALLSSLVTGLLMAAAFAVYIFLKTMDAKKPEARARSSGKNCCCWLLAQPSSLWALISWWSTARSLPSAWVCPKLWSLCCSWLWAPACLSWSPPLLL